MSVTVKFILGTVNYTDYLRVSLAKVSDPGTEVTVDYLDAPLSNYAFIKSGLDPDNYYVTFRDAPDELSLGTLVSQAFFNAQTGEFEYERRFYKIGHLPDDVSNTLTNLNDPYLVNRNVTGVFKEGFRYLVPDDEWSFDDATGDIDLTGLDFSEGETFIVEIKYSVGSSTTTSTSSLFGATIAVTGATYTISSTDKGKRFCLDAAGATQAVTLPALSALVTGDFVYLEHKRSGVQAQSRILTAGTDKVLFNGFNLGSNELSELWLSKGESLYLRKEGTYWEVILEYWGSRVGERMAATYQSHPNYLPEDGRLLDGDQYPALWWWINNVLPSTHVITDDTVVGSYTHPAAKVGLFVKHSTLKKFRLPNTQGMTEKGLADFDSYGADVNRTYDYPGGYQADQVGQYNDVRGNDGTTSTGIGYAGGNPAVFAFKTKVENSGLETRVKNIGVIYLRRI